MANYPNNIKVTFPTYLKENPQVRILKSIIALVRHSMNIK